MIEDNALFNIALAGHARGVARGWASQRKRSLLTPNGLALTVSLIDKIGHVSSIASSYQSHDHSNRHRALTF
jgi:hypothetical protein